MQHTKTPLSPNIAVITGDIVNSKAIREDKRTSLLKSMDDVFKAINAKLLGEKEMPFEMYRGDSFQGVIHQPEKSLLVSLIIRSKIRSIQWDDSQHTKSSKNNFDVRISIGIGMVDFVSSKIVQSDGQAFLLSGTGLDGLKNTESRLKVATPWEKINDELAVSFSFADAVISDWSFQQAEAFYWHLLENPTQTELAKILNISQPAASKRLKTGKAESIHILIKRYEQLILSQP